MKASSAKNKGRKFQQWVAQKISDLVGISWGSDQPIASREMGHSGTDVRLLPNALDVFPWSVECKRQENWSIPKWILQAKSNQIKRTNWLLFVRKNREDPIVILDANVFFKLLRQLPGERKGVISVRRKRWRKNLKS